MQLGFTEILLIVIVVVLVFGAKRIPELARALGRAQYEFKKAKKEIETEGRQLLEDESAAEKDLCARGENGPAAQPTDAKAPAKQEEGAES